MAAILRKIYWRIVHLGYRVVYFIVLCILKFAYWGCAEKVPPVKNPILLKSATKLAAEIREGKLKSQDVVLAYMERIFEVEPYINATVERHFEEAMHAAAEADILVSTGAMSREQLAKEKPLLGVPFSVKMLLTVKGYYSNAGCKLFEGLKAAEDAPTVAAMKKAGAIVLATTNAPEMGLNLESYNYVYGRTCNPYNTGRTSGGSSGGESALIGAAGSVIGLGNDLLGSVRIPSFFTGIFAHKPTRDFVSNGGCFPVPHPSMHKLLYTGPMCRYAEDLKITMKTLCNKTPLNFDQQVNFKNLKLHYMVPMRGAFVADVDGEIMDAIHKATSHFEATYGIRAKKVQLPLLNEAAWMTIHFLLAPVPSLKKLLTAGKDINLLLELINVLFRHSTLTPMTIVFMLAKNNPLFFNSSYDEYYTKLERRFQKELNAILQDENTVLLLPTCPKSAPYHYETGLLVPSVGYTSLFNVLSNPVTQCTMGLNKQGLPVGFQIVGRDQCDPLTIACAIELEKAFGGWIAPGKK